MRDQSLRGHIANLEQQGETIRIAKRTNPRENVSAIGWKAYDRLGKSTLFTDLEGFPGWRAASQIVADRRKWSIALGLAEDELISALAERIKRRVAPVGIDRRSAPVKEAILRGDDADLTRLPALWHAEDDPGPYIASGIAIIKDPETGIRNMSIHRQQVISKCNRDLLL